MKKQVKVLQSVIEESPVSEWFELSYAQFLTVPRLVMESMSVEWQRKMATLLEEMDETFDWRPERGRYWVKLRDFNGRFLELSLCDYRHGSIEHLRKPSTARVKRSSHGQR